MMARELFLPTLSYWRHGNPWTGSLGPLRFALETQGEMLLAEVWHGPLCREKSQMEARAQFPVSREGLDALRAWLLDGPLPSHEN